MVFNKFAKSKFSVAVIVGAGLLLFLMLLDYKNKQIASYESTQINWLKESYLSAIKAREAVSKVTFSAVINKPDVLSLYAKAYKSGEDNDTVRSALYEKMKEPYGELVKTGLQQLHFHTTTGHSFLRMHTLKKFGDPLADVRPSIRIANFDKKFVMGFEEGRIYNGFRYVFPLFWEDKHIGSVETSVASADMLEHMRGVNDGHYQMMLDKKVVLGTVFADEVSRNYRNCGLSDKFMVESASKRDEVIEKINKQMRTQIDTSLAAFKPFVLSAKLDGTNYSVAFLPIASISGANVAYIVKYTHDNSLNLIWTDFWIKSFAIVILTILALLFVLSIRNEIVAKEKAQASLEELNHSLEAEVVKKASEIAKQNAILQRQSKHAAMGEMIGAIAHQWRQPLNVLGLKIQDLGYANEYGELDANYLGEFEKSSMGLIRHMSNTIEDFRGFFRSDKTKEIFCIKEAVEEACALVQDQFRSHGIEIDMVGEGIKVLGRKSDLKQVVLNLLNNARDQVEEMTQKGMPVKPKIVIGFFEKNGKALLKIEDFAGGIKEENISKLFDSDFTTKDESKGTGIGLYMSKMIVNDLFDGEISVSNSGKGAIFEIAIPTATL